MSDMATEPLVRNAWYIAAWAHELDERPIARQILNEDLVLFRDGAGRAAALEDRCCHRGAPLSMGEAVQHGIRCGYHGMAFDGGGNCIDNPGDVIKPQVHRVRAYPVVERHRTIWVWTGAAAAADESLIVDYPHHEDDDWPFHFGRYEIDANYMFLVDNLMDLTHLGYVHGTTIGGDPDAHNIADLKTNRTDRGAHFLRWMMNSPPPPAFVKVADFKGQIDRWADFEYVAPSSVLQWAGALNAGTGARENRDQDGGMAIRLLHHATPKTDDTFHYFFSAGVRGHATDSPASSGFFQDVKEAFLEDKAFIEAQQRVVDRDPMRHLTMRGHDRAVGYARKAIRDLLAKEMRTAAE